MEKDHKEKPTDSNPFLVKLAFPIALSLAGFLISTLTRRIARGKQSQEEEEEDQMNYTDSLCHYDQFDEEEPPTCVQSLEDSREIAIVQCHEGANLKDETAIVQCHEGANLEQEISAIVQCDQEGANSEEEIATTQCQEGADLKDEIEDLKSLVACLEEREGALESQFYQYCNMKEEESAFQKLQIMCLGLKLESLESQNEQLENNVDELRGAVDKFETIEGEIKLLQRRVKRISKATRVHTHLIRKQGLMLMRANEELRRANEEMKEVADRTYKEKMDIEEKYSASMHEQRLMMDEYMSRLRDREVLYEQLQQQLRVQWSAEMEELIYIGWINSCLRRELIIAAEKEEEEEEEEEEVYDQEEKVKPLREVGDKVVVEIPADKHVRNCSVELYNTDSPSAVSDINRRTSMRVDAKNHHIGSRKPRLLRKLKGWAKGKGRC